jgi:hypothetical protein
MFVATSPSLPAIPPASLNPPKCYRIPVLHPDGLIVVITDNVKHGTADQLRVVYLAIGGVVTAAGYKLSNVWVLAASGTT